MSTLFDVPREAQEIAPGAVHVPDWLTEEQQVWLADRFAEWAAGPVPPRSARIGGHPMSVTTVCLGWHWQPYAYSREARDVNGQRVLDFPDWLVRLGRKAVADAGVSLAAPGGWGEPADYTPDAALANYYSVSARMGMHQDKDEVSLAPVVSLSLGDSCTFRFGNTENRNRPWVDLELRSGDLLVFGGESRLAYHGVTGILPGTSPPQLDGTALGRSGGRINLTLRHTGLDDQGEDT